MATQFETIAAQEQAGVEPASQPVPSQPSIGRVVGLTLGSVALSLGATAVAVGLARSRRQPRARRRSRVIKFQPRVAVFAPALTISMPFSAIAGRAAPSRNRGDRINRAGRVGPMRAPFLRPRRIVARRGRVARVHGA